MANKNGKNVNIKLDNETKSKLETLAYIKRCTIQDICIKSIQKTIEANADKIADVEKMRE